MNSKEVSINLVIKRSFLLWPAFTLGYMAVVFGADAARVSELLVKNFFTVRAEK